MTAVDIRGLTCDRQDCDDDDVPRKPYYITVKAAAAYMSVTERTVRRMIADGRLTGYRAQGSRFIRVDLNEVKKLFKPI